MLISPISPDLIKVGYISQTDGYISGLSVSDANTYERLNPGTVYIFVDGDANIRYLTIDEVNQLTTADLLRSDVCDTGPRPCGPPRIKFTGGEGVGAIANPIVDILGNLIAVDIVDGGYGYSSPPRVEVIDDCDNGSGAVLEAKVEQGVVTDVLVVDSGTGYLPPGQTVPQYPARICLKGVIVLNPGINYNCGVDQLVVTPANGARLSYECDTFGRIRSVNILSQGCYTELPIVSMQSTTGLNASFAPLFEVIRDPLIPELAPDDVVQVYDLAGLTLQGYVDGKTYYGNVYFEAGIKYAGTKNTGGRIVRVYDTKAESIASGQA